MNRWTPEKRRQLGLLVFGTLVAVAFLYLTVVSYLQSALKDARMRLEVARRNLELTETGLRVADRTVHEIERDRRRLQAFEETMAKGDQYLWVINSSLELLARHDLHNVSYEQPQPATMQVPPAVPYGASDFYINGWASYPNLGGFLMDLENQYPFARVNTLSIQASAPGLASVNERQVNFRLGFSCLTQSPPQEQ